MLGDVDGIGGVAPAPEVHPTVGRHAQAVGLGQRLLTRLHRGEEAPHLGVGLLGLALADPLTAMIKVAMPATTVNAGMPAISQTIGSCQALRVSIIAAVSGGVARAVLHDAHRPELVEEKYPAIHADAFLLVENRAARIELDRNRSKDRNRQRND